MGSLQCRHHGEYQLNCCSNYVKHICTPAHPPPPPPHQQHSTTPLRCSVMVSIANPKPEVVQPEEELHVSVITAVDQSQMKTCSRAAACCWLSRHRILVMHTSGAGVLDEPHPPPQLLIPSFILNPRAPYTLHGSHCRSNCANM